MKVRLAVGRDLCAGGQHQRLAFQIHMLPADEMRVSGHLGSLTNSGRQHVPPAAFCLLPSMFSPVLFFPDPWKQTAPSLRPLLLAPPLSSQVLSSPLSCPLTMTPPQVTPIPYLCPPNTPSYMACPAITHFFTCALSPTPLPYFCPTASLTPWNLGGLTLLYPHSYSLLIQKMKRPPLPCSHHLSLFYYRLPSYFSLSHNRFFN